MDFYFKNKQKNKKYCTSPLTMQKLRLYTNTVYNKGCLTVITESNEESKLKSEF